MVAHAIRNAMQSVIGHTDVVQPATAMADVRRAFKQYALCHIHNEFGLRPGPNEAASAIEYRAQKVVQLLDNFGYLRDPRNKVGEFFSSSFFQNFIINMLFLTPMELWKYVANDNLDTVFRLGGAALAATLHDFRNGYHKEGDASAAHWRESYSQVLHLVTAMHSEPTRGDWLVSLQQSLMARGRAGLAQSTTTIQ